MDIRSFIANFEKHLAPAERANQEAWWALATTGSQEAKEELIRTGKQYNQVFEDRDEYEQVKAWYQAREDLNDPGLIRQVEVLYKMFAGHQGDPEILHRIEELEAEANAVYSNHRGTINYKSVSENEIREILHNSNDTGLRQAAWEASKTVGPEVEDMVRELARLRNRLAREEGYRDHYARALDLQEIDFAELHDLMQELESATEAPFKNLKEALDTELRARFNTGELMPWHYSDPFFQAPPEQPQLDIDRYFAEKNLEELTRLTYESLGLEVQDILDRSDLYERQGKDQHAFCTALGREYPYDIRVLANIRSDSYWMNTMLHEFGHGVYDKYIDPSLPYLLRTYAHINSTEAIALMMGALADDPAWLAAIAGAPQDWLVEDQEYIAQRQRADRLVFIRWALVMFHFEQALYADPDRDGLNILWWDLVERFQHLNAPPGRDKPDWAAKIHVAIAPVYYHNYVLGNLTAAQLRAYMETRVARGPFFLSKEAGRYLQDVFFARGASRDWKKTLIQATGEKLNPEYFIRPLI